jgi:hypothetical protein
MNRSIQRPQASKDGTRLQQNWGVRRGGFSLLGGAVGKLDSLLDVALEAGNGSLQKLLLLVGDVAEDINGLLSTVGLGGRC